MQKGSLFSTKNPSSFPFPGLLCGSKIPFAGFHHREIVVRCREKSGVLPLKRFGDEVQILLFLSVRFSFLGLVFLFSNRPEEKGGDVAHVDIHLRKGNLDPFFLETPMDFGVKLMDGLQSFFQTAQVTAEG